MKRRLRVLLAAAFASLLVVLVGLTGAAPASAAPGDLPGGLFCKAAPPVPERPDQGIASWFIQAPAQAPTGDPFDPKSGVNLIDVYGLAGLNWEPAQTDSTTLTNLGIGSRLGGPLCAVGAKTDIDGQTSTSLANWGMIVPIAATGAAYALGNYAYDPTWLTTLDPLLTRVGQAVRDGIFNPLAPIAFLIAAVCLVFALRRMRISASLLTLGMCVAAITLAAVAGNYPVRATHTVTDVLRSTNQTVSNAFGQGSTTTTASSAVAPVVSDILYNEWVAGELGSSSSPVALKYGPQLYAANAYTWAEVKQMNDDPDSAEKITDAKQKAWTEIASKVKDEDPAAAQFLAGNHASNRMGAAFMSWMAVIFTLPFLIASFLLLIASYLVIALTVMLLGALALVMIAPNAHGVLRQIGRTVLACILNTVFFTTGVNVDILIVSTIMGHDTPLPWFFKVIISALVSWALWAMLKPFRKLIALSPHSDPILTAVNGMASPARSIAKTARSAVGSVASSAVGSFIGNRAADIAAEDDDDTRLDDRPGDPMPAGTYSYDQRLNQGASTSNPGPAPAPHVDPAQPVYAEAPALPVGSMPAPQELDDNGVDVGTPQARVNVDPERELPAPVAVPAIAAAPTGQPGAAPVAPATEATADDTDFTPDGEAQRPHASPTAVAGEDVFLVFKPSTGETHVWTGETTAASTTEKADTDA